MKSQVHYIEINSIEDDFERIELVELLKKYGCIMKVDFKGVQKRIEELLLYNFGLADASHITFAEFYNAVFISCDDKLLKKNQKHINSIRCINPLAFCEMEKLK
jgi:predicted nucleic acid-binding protein